MARIHIYSGKAFSIWLEYDSDGRLQLNVRGPLAPLGRLFLRKLNAFLRNERPILVEKNRIIFSTWLPPIPSGPLRRLIQAEIDIILQGKYRPQAISINASKQCMCDCKRCNMVKSEGLELSTYTLKKFIDDVLKLGAVTIGFSEGDPLLREDIVELVRYVEKDKALASIFTPGILLTEELAEELKKAGLYAVIIGITSPVPSEHDINRGYKGAFDKAIESIKAALSVGLYVSIHTHATPELVESGKLYGIYELARNLGVHEFTIWEAIPTWSYFSNEDIILRNYHRRAIIEFQRKVNKHEESGPKVFSMSFFEGPSFLGCMAGRRWLNLVDSGDITPCTYTPITFGNINHEDVEDIWRKIRRHPLYRRKFQSCMMLDPNFRSKIPAGGSFPIPAERLKAVS